MGRSGTALRLWARWRAILALQVRSSVARSANVNGLGRRDASSNVMVHERSARIFVNDFYQSFEVTRFVWQLQCESLYGVA